LGAGCIAKVEDTGGWQAGLLEGDGGWFNSPGILEKRQGIKTPEEGGGGGGSGRKKVFEKLVCRFKWLKPSSASGGKGGVTSSNGTSVGSTTPKMWFEKI